MKEIVELRVPEKVASRHLPPGEGRPVGDLGPFVRILEVTTSSPRYQQLIELHKRLIALGEDGLFLGWSIRHTYTAAEKRTARLFHLKITSVFEPAGEECGTVYDYSSTCPLCGSGRRQVGSLVLDTWKPPTNSCIAQTIADEWIVDERLASLLRASSQGSFQLHPVTLRSAESTRSAPQKEWFQLTINAEADLAIPPTRFGINPADEDQSGQHRCPEGHVAGLNLLSEVSVKAESWPGTPLARSRQLVGTRRGLLVPRPLILISSDVHAQIAATRMRGFTAEVAYLV